VPWCSTCDRFLSPPTVTADGTCPACGRPVDEGTIATKARAEPDEDLAPVPWHLKVLAVGIAIYLGWRLIQGIEWVFG
jgi:hypothetical protein